MKKEQVIAYIALIVVAFVWGSGFIATQYAIESQLSTEGIMTLRFIIGAFVMGLFGYKEIKKTTRKVFIHGVLAGVLLFGAFYSQTIGQGMTTVSNAAFITATNVVMIPFILWLLYKKRPSTLALVLSFCTMIGIVLLTWQPGAGMRFNTGDLVVLLCAFLFALHIVYLGSRCNEDPATLITFWQLLTAGVISAVLWLIIGEKPTAVQLEAAFLPVLYLGIFSSCLCYYLQTKAQQYVSPGTAGIVLSLEGVFGSFFSVLLGLEAFRLNMVFGGAIITLCIAMMSRQE